MRCTEPRDSPPMAGLRGDSPRRIRSDDVSSAVVLRDPRGFCRGAAHRGLLRASATDGAAFWPAPWSFPAASSIRATETRHGMTSRRTRRRGRTAGSSGSAGGTPSARSGLRGGRVPGARGRGVHLPLGQDPRLTPRLSRALLADALAEGADLGRELRGRGWRLDLARLVPWARWITPELEPQRFDTRFFLLPLPPGPGGRHDEHETTRSFWASPAAVLERARAGEIFLAPPTDAYPRAARRRPRRSPSARSPRARGRSLVPVCPHLRRGDGPPYLALPGDPAHPEPDARVAGPTRFVLRDGRFVSELRPERNTRRRPIQNFLQFGDSRIYPSSQ